MADSKITALTALTAADPTVDMFPVVDVSDTTMAASGTTKRISINNILACSPSATLAAATITGDLTVDTSTLKVDSANNRVGIGTASPAETLHVSGGNIRMSINQFLYLYYGSATNYASLGADNSGNVQVFTGLTSPANRFQIANDGVCTWSNVGGVAGTAMTLNSTGLGIAGSPVSGNKLFVEGSAQIGSSSTAGSNRLTIDGIGTVGNVPIIRFRSGGAAKAYVGLSGAYIGDTSTDLLLTTDAAGASVKFGSSDTGTVKMTLDASSNLLLGVTSNPNTARAYFRYDTLTTQPVINSASIVAAATSWNHFVGQSGNGSTVTTNNIFIRGNGDIVNANGIYGTISDLRLKENISDARNYLADLLKLRVVKYSLKEEASAVANKLGFIAQEVEQVFPTMVDTDSEDTKSIKISVLIPMLVKAIQELAARVQTLETR